MEFLGRLLEVTSPSHLVWTHDEGDNGGTVTTMTFEDAGGRTLLVGSDRIRVDVGDDRGARAT
jgi:hypothetical protein